MSANTTALTAEVSVTQPKYWVKGACQAWMDGADRKCGKFAEDYLCKRHINVAIKRREARLAKEAARVARWEAEKERQTPKWQAELARVNAEIARRDPAPPTTDMAAYGGVGCSTTARYQKNLLRDSNVSRMAELLKRRDYLEARLA